MQPQKHSHIEYLDHPADVKFRASGKTIEEAFEYAALAMFGAMIDTDTVQPATTLDIDLDADDCEELLYNFLSELLYLFEVEEIVFGRFDVERIGRYDDSYHLRAHATGEKINLERHRFDVGVKAVTFHDMMIEQTDVGYTVQVVVDT
ncbi:MAG TPA: archease [Methanosarcinales archaeon]|nr:archease [Methanosarcinales archaeon]